MPKRAAPEGQVIPRDGIRVLVADESPWSLMISKGALQALRLLKKGMS